MKNFGGPGGFQAADLMTLGIGTRISSGNHDHGGGNIVGLFCLKIPDLPSGRSYQEIHKIGNNTEKDSISIHIYGRDIDEVNVFDLENNEVRPMRIKYFSPECGGEDFVI